MKHLIRTTLLSLGLVFFGAVIGFSAMIIMRPLPAASTPVPVVVTPEPETPKPLVTITGPVKYTCELSGGMFKDGSCACPLEEGQMQEDMYDKETGFCQSTMGGPAGNAFNASVGLPWGAYESWNWIVLSACEKSGGSISGAMCVCTAPKVFDAQTWICK